MKFHTSVRAFRTLRLTISKKLSILSSFFVFIITKKKKKVSAVLNVGWFYHPRIRPASPASEGGVFTVELPGKPSPPACWEDPLEKELATHLGTLAWKISWTEEKPGGLQSMGLQRVGHD